MDDDGFAAPAPPTPTTRQERSPTPSGSVISCAGSLPSDLSFVDDKEQILGHSEFYSLVLAEHRKRTDAGVKVLRWKEVAKSLATQQPDFQDKTAEEIRSRYKYIKKKKQIKE